MAKIELYKNCKKVLEKDGNQKENLYYFDNIIYNPTTKTLIREDNNFKYFIDFDNSFSEVTIKENNYSLNIKIVIVNLIINKNIHEISYNIESEATIENKIVITF